jgi:hypothetical protein
MKLVNIVRAPFVLPPVTLELTADEAQILFDNLHMLQKSNDWFEANMAGKARSSGVYAALDRFGFKPSTEPGIVEIKS